MTIDTIMRPATSPTSHQLSAALAMVMAVAETIRELGEVPSGVLYAQLCGRVTVDGYQGILRNLKGAGLVAEDASHLLRWIGPKLEER